MEENYSKELLFKVPYGIYLITTASGDEKSGCIINTFSQMADGPAKGVISIHKDSKTAELIKESKIFITSFLSENISFEVISHFGLKSGKSIDKFSKEYSNIFSYELDKNGIPYIKENVVGNVTCKVIEITDLGTHYLFVFEILDIDYIDKTLKVLTYDEYRKRKNKMNRPEYICSVCHYIYDGDEDFENLPDDYVCPVCGMPKSVFYKREINK